MDKKQPNIRAFEALAAFATDSEGDLENLSPDELQERLANQGISQEGLTKLTQLRLRRIRNELDARQAQAEAAKKTGKPIERGILRLSLQSMQPLAARTADSAADGDLEVIARLTQDENPDESNGA